MNKFLILDIGAGTMDILYVEYYLRIHPGRKRRLMNLFYHAEFLRYGHLIEVYRRAFLGISGQRKAKNKKRKRKN